MDWKSKTSWTLSRCALGHLFFAAKERTTRNKALFFFRKKKHWGWFGKRRAGAENNSCHELGPDSHILLELIAHGCTPWMIDIMIYIIIVHVQCRQIYVIWINTIYGLIVRLKDTRMLRPLHGLPATWQSKAVSSDFLNCLKQASIILCKPQARRRTSLRATTRKEFHIYPSTPFRRRGNIVLWWCRLMH